MAYQVIIIEDDPMVAAIDRKYVETDPRFQVTHVLKSGGECPGRAGAQPAGSDHFRLLHPIHERDGVCGPPPRRGAVSGHHYGHLGE